MRFLARPSADPTDVSLLQTRASAPVRGRPRSLWRTTVLSAIAACAMTVGASGVAFADSASLSFTDSSGKSDPAADVGRTASLTGSTAAPKYVYVKWRASGGAACAPSASSDSGSYDFGGRWSDNFYGESVNGNFTLKATGSWDQPGTYLFCIWIADNGSQSVTPISQTVTFRAPAGTVSGAVSPSSPAPDQSTTLTVTGSSEAPKFLYAKLRPAGAACAPSYSADTGTGLISDQSVNGNFTTSTSFTVSTAGDQLICLWVADSRSDGSPEAGPQPMTFTVVAPPPPPPPPPSCIVPALVSGTALIAVQNALVGASCSVGKKSYSRSRRYPRGTLIKLLPAAGTKLDNNSPVRVVLSSGAPCRVPTVRRGMKLALAKARLTAASCVAGTITRRRSGTRKGRVIRFTQASGTSLPQGSRVGIVISRGRSHTRR